MKYISLHSHSTFSISDSVIKIPEMVAKAKEGGQKALALTDHGSVSGLLEFNTTCEDQGIQALYGMELYCINDYNNRKDENREHLIVIAKDETGLQQLWELSSISNNKFYHRPIIEYSDLKQLSDVDHLICTSACGFGRIPAMIEREESQEKIIEEYYSKFYNVFGDDFYLELQPHFYNELELQHRINEGLIELADIVSGKLIIATDAHYLNKGDHDLRTIIQADRWKKSFTEQLNGKYKTLSSNYYCSTFHEIQGLVNDYNDSVKEHTDIGIITDDILKTCCKNTVKAANKCKDDIFLKYEKRIPEFTQEEQQKLLDLYEIEI